MPSAGIIPLPAGVSLHTPRVLLAGFYPRRSQFDQPLKKPAGRAGPAACSPQAFPSLMGLPIVAVVKEIDAVQVRSTSLPPVPVEKLSRWRGGTKTMTLRVADRVRKAPGNKRVRWQGLVRDESWDFALWYGSI